MPTYECSECGRTPVERSYNVMAVEVVCPECEEFNPHVNMDHPRVRALLEKFDIEPTATNVVKAVRGQL